MDDLPCKGSASHFQATCSVRQTKTSHPIHISILRFLRLLCSNRTMLVEGDADLHGRHHRLNEIDRTPSELRAFIAHVLTSHEAERRRIARDLHDRLAQQTALLAFTTAHLADGCSASGVASDQDFTSIHEGLSELSEQLRCLSSILFPSILEDLGLNVALRRLVETERSDGAPMTFRDTDARIELPLQSATALYRIAQQAIQNATQHAPGAPVTVTLSVQLEQLQLRIEDAGPGFEPAAVRAGKGFGLIEMEERARIAGGVLLLTSAPGKGTVVIAQVPLERV